MSSTFLDLLDPFSKKYFQALFSPCRTWRYTLHRIWTTDKPPAMFVGLNPSTADEEVNDPTVRRCIRFARDWGYGGLVMTNLFAFRATDPRDLKKALSPVGEENDRWLLKSARSAGVVVAAWGNHGSYKNRDKIFLKLFRDIGIPLKCLAITKSGQPQHPLYLRADTPLKDYP